MNLKTKLLESVYIHTFVRIKSLNCFLIPKIADPRVPEVLPILRYNAECNLIAIEKYVLFLRYL